MCDLKQLLNKDRVLKEQLKGCKNELERILVINELMQDGQSN